MTKTIKAVYEKGLIRPLEPLKLPEGARLDVIVIIRDEVKVHDNASEILAEIAACLSEVKTMLLVAATTIQFCIQANRFKEFRI